MSTWTWTFETTGGDALGESQPFDNRGDAESWIGETFGDLLERGIDQARLHEDGAEVYGPMSLHAD